MNADPLAPLRAPLRAFVTRLDRAHHDSRADLCVAEAARTGGGILWPMATRHAGRAVVTLHTFTATGTTMDQAVRNWLTMARMHLAHRPARLHFTSHAEEIAHVRAEAQARAGGARP